VYNIYYWLIYNGIIETQPQSPTKYYDPSIKTVFFKDNQMDLSTFLQTHYLNDKDIQYKPTKSNIDPYFKNNKSSLYSLYYVDTITEKITTEKQLVACITGRKVNVYGITNGLTCYYIDYLCIHKHYRKQGIAPKMIQSHEYNQRKATNNSISLFKREGHLNLIVPLVAYFTYGFNIYGWNKTEYPVTIIKVTKLMIKDIYDIIDASGFNIKICMDSHVLLDLLKSDNIYIYALMVNNIIGGVYFLRDGNTWYKNKKTIELFGSINCGIENSIFVAGFVSVLQPMMDNYQFLWIENLSHNYIILDNIRLKYKYNTICPMAYYFYNYATRPCIAKNILIIV